MSQTEPRNDYEYLIGYDEEPDYDEEPIDLDPWEVDAMDRANWHLRHVHRIRARRAELASHFDAEIARLTMRRDTLDNRLAAEERWHERPLLGLHAAMRAADEKRASVTHACGTLRSRRTQAEWLYEPDEEGVEHTETFLAWAAEHHPELIGPRSLGARVPAAVAPALAAALTEALTKLLPPPAEGDEAPVVVLSEIAPDKRAVKSTLVQRDKKGKAVVLGVDPETAEVVPGLVVIPAGYDFSVDTDVDE